MISFAPNEEQKMFQDTAREFGQNELYGRQREAETLGAVPEDILSAYHEMGLATMGIPEETGGAGLDGVELRG